MDVEGRNDETIGHLFFRNLTILAAEISETLSFFRLSNNKSNLGSQIFCADSKNQLPRTSRSDGLGISCNVANSYLFVYHILF